MPNSLKGFDRIVCINLDERTDRWEQVQQTCQGLLGDSELERFSAIKLNIAEEYVHNARAGCLLSHRRVMKEAFDAGLESVLVFEDDLTFHPEFQELIHPTMSTLGKTKWDVFYLGFTPKAPLLPAGEGLVRTFGGVTTHAIAYHRRAIPKLLQLLPDESDVLSFLSRYKSVDRYYWQQIAGRMNCYAASPLLVFQCDDFSDIQQAQTLSNQQQAKAAFERHLIQNPSIFSSSKLQLGRVMNRLKYGIDGTRRVLLRPIKPSSPA